MSKAGKIIVFVLVLLVIIIGVTVLKQESGMSILWLGAIAIIVIYRSMFGKKKNKNTGSDNDLTLKK